MAIYQARPNKIEAVQWAGDNYDEVINLVTRAKGADLRYHEQVGKNIFLDGRGWKATLLPRTYLVVQESGVMSAMGEDQFTFLFADRYDEIDENGNVIDPKKKRKKRMPSRKEF